VLHVTAVDEANGTLTGYWLHAEDWPALIQVGSVLLKRQITPAAPGRPEHRTVSLYRWTSDPNMPLTKVAEWCGLDSGWQSVIARTVGYWLIHHTD
jgi:hypothetical protein